MYKTALRSSTRSGFRSLRAPFSTSVVRRQGPQYQPPTPPPAQESSNAHRDFYKSFGRPTAKVFLMAWATYQILYWSWSKLEFMEEKGEKEEELKRLELELEAAVKEKESAAAAASSGATDPPVQQGDESKGRSWWKFF